MPQRSAPPIPPRPQHPPTQWASQTAGPQIGLDLILIGPYYEHGCPSGICKKGPPGSRAKFDGRVLARVLADQLDAQTRRSANQQPRRLTHPIPAVSVTYDTTNPHPPALDCGAPSAGLLVIVDAKRGDVGTTNDAYAEACLGSDAPLGADALTVHPYPTMGPAA
jgi:hypothetical protein